jgi:voltage-gated potassium channel
MDRWTDRLHAAFHRTSDPAYRAVERVILVLIFASIGLFGVDIYLGEAHAAHDLLRRLDQGLLGVFALEFALRVLTFRPSTLTFFHVPAHTRVRAHLLGRLRFMLSPMLLIDLLAILALYPALRGLRALRLLRLLRSTHLFRYSNPIHNVVQAFRDNALLYLSAFSLLGAATVIGGTSITLIERGENPELTSIADGLWWAIVTLTTVGFGDIAPVTTLGRIVGATLMVSGMFTLALFAGIVGHTLLGIFMTLRQEQFRMSHSINHVIICGHDRGSRLLLDAVLAELDADEQELIIFAEGERPNDIPPAFRWVSGDPTKESELDKTRMAQASRVIVVGNRRVSPQQADASTILTVFTIRAWMATQPRASLRKAPLRIICEILDAENVFHARAAGADEVIETTRLGFSMMSHALVMPGTAHIMGRIASLGAHSMYVGANPNAEPMAFASLVHKLKAERGILVLGTWDAGAGHEHLNPPDDTTIAADATLVYLAEQAVLPAT